jgi:hypothetical protein
MSETLEDYLASEYHVDRGDIHDLELALEDVANVFIYACNEGRWPYEFSNNTKDRAAQISHGTQAMISAALGKMTGLSTLASGRGARLKLDCSKDLEAARNQGVNCLIENIKSEGALISSTFGKNDPMTLSHVTDLLRGMKDESDAGDLKSALAPAIAELRGLCETDPATGEPLLRNLPTLHTKQATGSSASVEQASGSAGTKLNYLKNAFVPLRIFEPSVIWVITPYSRILLRIWRRKRNSMPHILGFSRQPSTITCLSAPLRTVASILLNSSFVLRDFYYALEMS